MQFVGLPHQPAVPRHPRLEIRVVCRIQPHNPSSPAEPRHAQLLGVRLPRGLGPCHRGVEIAHHLLVGNLRHHLGDDLAEVGHLGDVPLPGIQLGGHGEVTQLGEPTADVPDVLMHAENLLHHQHRGERAPLVGMGAISRNLSITHGNLHLARHQPRGVGGDGLRRNGLDRQCEARGQRGHHEVPPGEVGEGLQTSQVGIHDGPLRGVSRQQWQVLREEQGTFTVQVPQPAAGPWAVPGPSMEQPHRAPSIDVPILPSQTAPTLRSRLRADICDRPHPSRAPNSTTVGRGGAGSGGLRCFREIVRLPMGRWLGCWPPKGAAWRGNAARE